MTGAGDRSSAPATVRPDSFALSAMVALAYVLKNSTTRALWTGVTSGTFVHRTRSRWRARCAAHPVGHRCGGRRSCRLARAAPPAGEAVVEGVVAGLKILLAAVAFTAAAATPAFAQTTLRDDRGADIGFASAPLRIVSLLPSLTESVCALGACGRLVGTDRFSNWPSEVLALPKLGGLDDAQIERIVALKPDVVLAAPSARVIERLEALGVRVVVLESQTHADVRRTLTLLAALLDAAAAADRVWTAIERDTRSAAERVPVALRGQRVYFEIDATPYAAGAGSFVGETLAQLGMANAVPAELGPFPKLNPEYVVRAQPDIVMAAERSIGEMPRRPGWSALHALQRGQRCGFPAERYELLLRPGPRMGEAAGVLADCLVAIAQARLR